MWRIVVFVFLFHVRVIVVDLQNIKKNKSIQLPASAVKVTLLAFAAERRAAVARRSAANPPHAAASVNDETDGRADGQTDGPSTD